MKRIWLKKSRKTGELKNILLLLLLLFLFFSFPQSVRSPEISYLRVLLLLRPFKLVILWLSWESG